MIVLLTGHRKSGITLLHRFFDNNKDFNVYPNDFCYFYMFFPGYAEKYKKNKSAAIKRLININRIKLKNFCKQYNYPLINLKKNDLLLKNHFKKKDIFDKKILFEIIRDYWTNISNSNSKNHFLFKETSQAMYFEEYNKIFKNFKMINIIRDPRDNLASILDGYDKYYKIKENNRNNIMFNFIFKALNDLKFAKINENYENFLNIKYEDIIFYPKKSLNKICNFLSIEIANLKKPTIFGKPFYGNNFNKKIVGLSKNNIGNWKNRLNKNEQNIINHYFDDFLNVFGYEKTKTKKNHSKYITKFSDDINFRFFFKDYLKIKKRRN